MCRNLQHGSAIVFFFFTGAKEAHSCVNKNISIHILEVVRLVD